MLVATRYEIMRGLRPSSRTKIPLKEKPVRVATMLNEVKFLATGGQMIHLKTVFLEDRMHDWDWHKGEFRYYSHIFDEPADVLIVYEYVDQQFCPLCGKEAHLPPCPVRSL